MQTRDVVIVDYARTAFGRQGGIFKDVLPSDLGGFAIRGLIERSGIDKDKIDGVMMGSAYHDLQTLALARYAEQVAGLPFEATGTTVEMQCGSGIVSINHAAWAIAIGDADIMIAGGCESCSTVPAKFPTHGIPYRMMAPAAVKQKLSPFPEMDISMIEISDKLAELFGITREECDEFACASQMRLQHAYQTGLIGSEILPYVYPATRKTPERIIDKDEHPRPDTTMEGLRKLKAIRPDGVTTAGNASGLNDGAAFVLMMTKEKANELGFVPIARWVAGGTAGCRPDLMGIGASYGLLVALKHADIALDDLSVIECNEAFAAQNLAVIKDLENKTGITIDRAKWNPNGGAIAIGHPNGASGGRIAIFAMKQMEAFGGKYGAFTSCCGGGQGAACILENLR